MRVALIAYTYSESHGGVERYVSNFARGLLDRGHEVHVLCHKAPHTPSRPGLLVQRVPVTTWYSPLRYASFARNVAALVRRERFDIVHSFGRTYSQDICRIGGGAHWEYLLHTDPALRSAFGRFLRRWNPRDRIILNLERRCFQPGATQQFICVSGRCKEEIQRHFGVPDGAIAVIHNGVDSKRFSTAAREPARSRTRALFGIADADLVALFVGTGFERKGLRFAIEAAALIPKEVPLRLLVVGRGSVGAYRELARRLKLRDRVLFLGEREPITDFYAAADLLILPSLYDPFPNVCLEAMACGLPIVTTRMTGVAEIVRHGVDALLVDRGYDVVDLAGALRQLLDPARREAIGRAARATAERCSMEDNLQRNLAIYEEVLARKRAGPPAARA